MTVGVKTAVNHPVHQTEVQLTPTSSPFLYEVGHNNKVSFARRAHKEPSSLCLRMLIALRIRDLNDEEREV